MNENTPLPRRARWPWITALVLTVAAGAGVWALAPDGDKTATTPEPTPSASLSLQAADRPAGASSSEPAPEAEPVDTAAEVEQPDQAAQADPASAPGPLDDAAVQQAYDAGTAAVAAVVAQPLDETSDQRRERLAGLFAAGSPTPSAAPAVDLASIGVTSLGRVEAAGIAWTEPFDPGDGRIGFLVAVTAQSYGVRDAGEAVAWKDTSTQMWRVLLAYDGTAWVPQVAYLADQAEPTGAQG